MNPLATRIIARSRLEAMDWSLVLISQGIESTIVRQEDGSAWFIDVPGSDSGRATEAIRLYQLENRGWRLRREVFQPGLIFDWVSLAWVILICAFYWINATMDLETAGVLDTVALAHGQWWRLFTAIWLHADLAHLASNATFGVVLLGLAMGRYGTGPALLAAYVAGIAGNLLSWTFSTRPHLGLGASGMVMGCLGLLAIQSLVLWRRSSRTGKDFLAGLLGGLMLFVLLGLAPGTDVVAHFGGFASGLILGAFLAPFIQQLRKPLPNLIGGLCFVALVLWPWCLALTHPTR